MTLDALAAAVAVLVWPLVVLIIAYIFRPSTWPK